MTDDLLRTRLDAFYRNGRSYAKAAKELGIERGTLWRYLQQQSMKGNIDLTSGTPLPGFQIVSVSQTENADGDVTSTSIRQRPDSAGPFELPSTHMVRARSILLDSAGNIRSQWVKTSAADTRLSNLCDALRHEFSGACGEATPKLSNDVVPTFGILNVLPLFDVHVGLLSWAEETGEDFDLDILRERMLRMANRLMAQMPAGDELLIINGGDYFHVDDTRNQTPAHHHALDADSRYYKILRAGIALQRSVINIARQKHLRVTLANLPGNHDPHAYMALMLAQSEHYRNCPDVTVIESPNPFFYRRHGSCLLGATHGDKLKPQQMVLHMANHEAWSTTTHRHFFYGHFHNERLAIHGGVRTECVGTITGKDYFSHGHGFLTPRVLQGLTFHTDEGLIGRSFVNLPVEKWRESIRTAHLDGQPQALPH